MAEQLVDKGEDWQETDEGQAHGRRRARRIVAACAVAVVAAGTGLVIARPWAGDSSSSSQASVETSLSHNDDAPAVTLSNLLVLGDIGQPLTVQWASDAASNGDQMGKPTGRRTIAMLAKPGATSDGPWLWVDVELLDRWDRQSFDPQSYIGDSGGHSVTVGTNKGYYLDSDWTGSTLLLFGPVNDGFAVGLNSQGLTQPELMSIAEELTLDEHTSDATASPVFGPMVSELGLEPIAAFEQDVWGFSGAGGGNALSALGGGFGPTATSVSYLTEDGKTVSVSNDVSLAGVDFAAVATLAFDDAEAVTVHGLPAMKGSNQFSGDMVVWVEGGRTISVAGDIDDLLAAAEKVEVVDAATWSSLVQESQANMGNMSNGVSESWLIGAGDLDDSTTWLIEGGLDDDGGFVLCSSAIGTDGSMMQGCGSRREVDAPGLFANDGLSLNGGEAVGLVATVPNNLGAATLRFTATGGAVTEVALKVVRSDWSFTAGALGVTTTGTGVLLAADGTALATLEVTQDVLSTGSGVGGDATASTVAAATGG